MDRKAFQDYYSDEVSYCFGCGRLNPEGYHFKSYWDGDEAVCIYHPKPYHAAIPGYVYGGLIASIIDCHSTGTAAAYAYRQAGRELGTKPPFRYVTASLHVEFLCPSPIDRPLAARAVVLESKGRKMVVESRVYAGEELCATGNVVVVEMPDDWLNLA